MFPNMRKALVTGITGQDGSYLAELLCEKGYEVYGMHRRCSVDDYFKRIDHLKGKINLVQGDLIDGASLDQIMKNVKPDEIYNLGSQSQVAVSFLQPYVTREINWHGVTRLVDRMKEHVPQSKFYQASTSELFGAVLETPQNEKTPFNLFMSASIIIFTSSSKFIVGSHFNFLLALVGSPNKL